VFADFVCGVWIVATLGGQQPPAQDPFATAVADLRKLITEQRDLIDSQSRRIDALEQELAKLRQQHPSELQTVEQRLEQVEQAVQRSPEMPREVLSSAEFPGAWRIPGTDASLKLGGQVRMMLVHTLGPLGTDDKFVTSSIPVEEQQRAGEDARTVYSPRPSRLNFDFRKPYAGSAVRMFIEGDFAGAGNTMRLRHAFIQGPSWLVGQTWSTFSDPEAEPLGIDFEGLNAISLFRQPQIRYSHRLRERLQLALALENPAPSLTGAEGVNLSPDVIARLRWTPPSRERGVFSAEHVQAAFLFRQLRGELTDQSDTTLSTGGFGANVSGVLVPVWDADDRLKFAVNGGWGIGRYITDLDTLGGQDAIYDSLAGTLRAPRAVSGYFGYERLWRRTFTSAFTYGIVDIRPFDFQSSDSLKRTQRATINLTWTIVPEADIVVEFLAGRRVNKDNRRGTSSQIQAGWTYRF
jgi:hypothetical protein